MSTSASPPVPTDRDDTTRRSHEELIGRGGVNDIDAILAVPPTDPAERLHAVADPSDCTFTWDYERTRPQLGKLYEKAKTSQWNATTDLDWSIEVDPDLVSVEAQNTDGNVVSIRALADLPDSPVRAWGDAEWHTLGVEINRWRLSQFLHGEQGALVCTAKIVETVPWIDAKYYAATQVVDEARHVEVFGRYVGEKLGGAYPINAHLRLLLDDIVGDPRWDMTYLGMQIMVEGLALAAFGFMHQLTQEPLLKQLLRYVMSDEARHVAFGVLSLKEFYAGLSGAEIRERQEFAFEAAVRMRDRFLAQEVWERMEVDVPSIVRLLVEHPAPDTALFRQLLFSKIVPNCRKLGLLDAGDAWLRDRFTEMGVIQFEHAADTGEEYEAFDLTHA
jgi:hypothetical protein